MTQHALMHTSHDTSTIGRFAPRSRTTKTPTFAYDIHSGVLVRQLLVALGGGTGRDQLPFRHGQPPDDCAFGWPAALSWLQAILAARVDAAQVVSPYSGQELQRVLLARASGLSVVPCRVTTGAAPCTLAQSDVEASRCGCFAHAMHSVQGAARCANHRDAPRCRCTQVVMHRGARCTSVHGDARRAKMRCLSQYLTSLVFLVLLQCCPRVKETFNRAGMHLGAGAHSVQ